MATKLLVIFLSTFFSMSTYAERVIGYKIPGNDLLALGQQKTQLRLCSECEAKWYVDYENIVLREYADEITKQQALNLLLSRSHKTIYLGLGAETQAIYYINFGNIEGPFDVSATEVFGGNNYE